MKKKLDHLKNTRIAVMVVFGVAILSYVIFPGVGLIVAGALALFVGVPMLAVLAIVSIVQLTKRPEPQSKENAESSIEQRSSERLRQLGWLNIIIGAVLVVISVVNLVLAQQHDVWAQQFEYPIWIIVASISIFSFSLAGSYFKAASRGSKTSQG